MKLTRDIANQIKNLNENEIYNTWYLSSNITPVFVVEDGTLVIKTIDKQIEIGKTLECLLRALCVFSYCPIWYFQNQIDTKDFDNENWIYDLISLNIVFAENLTNGVFLRPTKNLYRLFREPPKPYKTIPYNMLTHDMSKFDIFFQCLNGVQKDIINIIEARGIKNLIYENELLCHDNIDCSVMGLLDENYTDLATYNSIKILDESNIKIHKSNTDRIKEVESLIINDMRKGKIETYELTDYSALFASNVDCNKEIVLQFPDLIIPIKRNKDLSPNSIAIEVEITCKGYDHYLQNLAKYKNNLKYGVVIWFVNDIRTKTRIYQAYKAIGGTGYTKTYIINYVTPREYIMKRV